MPVIPKHPPRDFLDTIANYYETKPKDLIKTLRYPMEWASVVAKNLLENSQFNRGLSALKHGTSIFAWLEFATDFNTFRLNTLDYLLGKPDGTGHNISIVKVGCLLGDALNKTCEVAKWLWDIKVISISMTLANKLMFVNGTSIMIGFSNRIYTNINDLQTCSADKKTLHMWKLAKNISLFSLGMFYSIASLTGLLNPILMLSLLTISLISSYASFILENPISQPKPDQSYWNKIKIWAQSVPLPG